MFRDSGEVNVNALPSKSSLASLADHLHQLLRHGLGDTSCGSCLGCLTESPKSPLLALSTLLPASNSILVQSPSFSTRSSECPASSSSTVKVENSENSFTSQNTIRTLGCASFALQPAFSQLHSPNTHVYLLHQNFTPFNQFDETLCQNFNLTNFGSLLYHYPISLPHAQEKHARFFCSRTPENRPRISCFFVAVVVVFTGGFFSSIFNKHHAASRRPPETSSATASQLLGENFLFLLGGESPREEEGGHKFSSLSPRIKEEADFPREFFRACFFCADRIFLILIFYLTCFRFHCFFTELMLELTSLLQNPLHNICSDSVLIGVVGRS